MCLIGCSLGLIGCKKNPFDYRTKFVGDYSFEVNERYITDYPNSISDTTYSYEGQIDYGTMENTIVILFAETHGREIELFEDGTMGECYNCWKYELEGEFKAKDELEFFLRDGSQGFTWIYRVTGEKK